MALLRTALPACGAGEGCNFASLNNPGPDKPILAQINIEYSDTPYKRGTPDRRGRQPATGSGFIVPSGAAQLSQQRQA